MPNIIVSFDSEKMTDLDENCELLGLTRSQYLSHLFIWGGWVLEQAKQGQTVLSIDNETKICSAILSSPKLELLICSYKAVRLLGK